MMFFTIKQSTTERISQPDLCQLNHFDPKFFETCLKTSVMTIRFLRESNQCQTLDVTTITCCRNSCAPALDECLPPKWKVVGLTEKIMHVRVIASAAKVVFDQVLLPNDPTDVDNIPVRANCTLKFGLEMWKKGETGLPECESVEGALGEGMWK